MSIRDLYQEVILDHNKNPRNFKEDSDATNYAKGYNPLCGDSLKIFLQVKDDIVETANFTGCGCAISMASGSLMTESIVGKTCVEVKKIFEQMHLMLTEGDENIELGKLSVLSGVNEFPARVKCASLAWHTLMAALKNSKTDVKTE